MMTNCPVCGKLTCIHWPEHWVYRRGSTYYCGENCMEIDMTRTLSALNKAVKRRKDHSMTKITLEQKKKAVEIAIGGENPLEFLRKCGSNAPDKTWWAIKAALKVKDPDLYEKIPDMRKKAKPEATVKVDGPLRIQTEEPEKVKIISEQKPLKPGLRGLNNSDFEVSAIKHPIFGEFYYDQKFGMVDWRTPDGEEVSLSPKNWKELYLIIPDVMGILGVPDDE